MFESLMKEHKESRMIDALRDNLILERRKLKKERISIPEAYRKLASLHAEDRLALSILKKMEDEERYAKEQSLVLMLRIACILSVAVFLVLAIVLGLMVRQNWSITAKCVAACVLIAVFVLISFGIIKLGLYIVEKEESKLKSK